MTDSHLTGDPIDILTEHITRKGLRMTRQRRLIAEVMMATDGHVNIDQLYGEVRKRDPNVGYATIYRTLKLLTDAGLAVSANFGDGPVRFEAAINRHHHDHLICRQCGTIIEFECEEIEALQERVCADNNFRMTDHRMEIYGVCASCS